MAQVVFTANGSGSWTCPTGVTAVDVDVWGAGGSGGAAVLGGGGGGGGGGYSKKTVTVVPGTNYSYTVGVGAIGAAGGQSWFKSATDVQANGGALGIDGVLTTQGAGGAGAAVGIGTTTTAGGVGGGGGLLQTLGAGGGGSGGNTGNGGAGASAQTGGAAGTGTPSGAVGATGGGVATPATVASSPGAGGGGASTTGARSAGANGRVTLTYNLPATDDASSSADSITKKTVTLGKSDTGASSDVFSRTVNSQRTFTDTGNVADNPSKKVTRPLSDNLGATSSSSGGSFTFLG